MANTIKIKRSAVSGKVPTTTDLELGELAVNTFDGKLYTKKDNGTASIVEINPASVTSFSAGTTGLTPSTGTTGAVTLAGTLAVANGGTGVTTSTGTGSTVLSTSPILVTPLLGTPTSGTLTNCTGYTFANIASKPTTISGFGITDAPTFSGNNAFTGANTFTNSTGQVFRQAATQDGILLRGRAGGTTSLSVEIIPTTLTASRTLTAPDVSGTIITTGDTGTVTSAMIADGAIVNADINASAAIADSKLATISTAGKVSNSATTATSANTASAIVARDGSGNFSAGTITAALSGNASTATTLQTARTIQGVSFNGSANITVVTAGTGISVSGTAVTNTGVTSLNGSTGAISNVATTNSAQSFTAAQRGSVSALTDGATITPDFSTANNFSVTLGGNRTLANPTNLTAGQSGAIAITQDGTGSRTLSFGSYWKFASGTAPTLTTTASKVDLLVYYVESSTRISAQVILNMGG